MKKTMLSLFLIAMFLVSACAPAAPTETTNLGPQAGSLFSEADLAIALSGTAYHLREDSAPLLAALGTGYEYSEMVSCVYDGKDKTYQYTGITVSTVPVDGKDVTELITLTDDTYETLRGVRVGASRADCIAAYGEKYFDDGYLTYSLTNDPADIEAERIQFEFAGDAVAAIYIYSPSY